MLGRMILDRTITNFVSNFEAVRLSGVPPHVRVWIREEDDLSLSRARVRIEEALRPFLGTVKVTVEPDPWIPRGSRPTGDGGRS
jgi:hypothetical protein